MNYNTKLQKLELDLQRIHAMVSELAAESEERSQAGIAFEKLQMLGRQAAFVSHYVGQLDEDLRNQYAAVLSSVVSWEDQTEKRIKQYYFIARILGSCQTERSLEELVRDANLISIKEFETLANGLGKRGQKMLLFDILLMITFQGDICEKQLDYFCEINTYFHTAEKELQSIYGLVNCILKAEERRIYRYAASFPLNDISCYLHHPIPGRVVTSVEEISQVNDTNIVICGVTFQNTEVWIDDYQKEQVTFIECKFENVAYVGAEHTRVEIDQCGFSKCEKNDEQYSKTNSIDSKRKSKAKALFAFSEAKIQNCYFEGCKLSNDEEEGDRALLKVRSGLIKQCRFEECLINIMSSHDKEFGTIVFLENARIEECGFTNCDAYGIGRKNPHKEMVPDLYAGMSPGMSSDMPTALSSLVSSMFVSLSSRLSCDIPSEYQCMQIVFCKDGSVENCEFHGCMCGGLKGETTEIHNFIINAIGTMERNNTFTDCQAQANVGSAVWRS